MHSLKKDANTGIKSTNSNFRISNNLNNCIDKIKIENNFSIETYTLKNNLQFNNLKNKNEMLLQKKHRMDFKLQRAFDTDIINKKEFSSNMFSSLNLINNKVKIKIKKNQN